MQDEREMPETNEAPETSRASDANEAQTAQVPKGAEAAHADPLEERRRKTLRRRIGYGIAATVVLAAVVGLQVLSGNAKEQASGATVEERVVSSAVERANMTKKLASFGTLASADEEDINVPGSIKVTEYHVSAGDSVKKGDVIASVDRTTVLASIADVQELIDKLDAEVEDLKDDSISSSLTAPANGTVVKVYAQSGDEVVDTIYEHGALMLISLDGLLAVNVNNDGTLNVGDAVRVTGADGTSCDGRVADVEKEQLTVTVDLGTLGFDEKVSVQGDSGNLGTGKMFVYSQQKITGYSGTVSSVSVSEGSSVSVGDTLLTLSDTDYAADYQTLLKSREKLVRQLNKLTEISEVGSVCAEQDGVISTTNADLLETNSQAASTKGIASPHSAFTRAASKGEVGTDSRNTASMQDVAEQDDGRADDEPAQAEKTSVQANIVWVDSSGNALAEGLPDSVTVALSANGKEIDAKTLNAGGGWSCTFDGLPSADEGGAIAYTAVLKSAVSGFSTATHSSGSTVTFTMMSTSSADSSDDRDGSDSSQGSSGSGSGSSGSSEQDSNANQGSGKTSGSGSDASGSSSPGPSKRNSNGSSASSPKGQPDGSSASSAKGGAKGGMPSGALGAGVANGSRVDANSSGLLTEEGATIEDAKSEASDPYAYAETTLGTMTPNDTASVDITVDELDIGSIVVGANAQVTLDALSGQSFEGKITALDPFGTNSGGNTKYTVTVSVGKQEDMLLGMNASVEIDLADFEGILIIPEAALVEQDSKTYVYTAYDEESDELGGLVEVITGNADGTNAEIDSGLAPGQECYYRYADEISYTFKG